MTSCGAGAWGDPRRDAPAPARGPCASHPAATRVAPAPAKFAPAAAGPPQRPATAAGGLPPGRAGRQERLARLPRAHRATRASLGRVHARAPQAASPRPKPRPASERPGRRRRSLPPAPPGPGCTPDAGDREALPFSFSSGGPGKDPRAPAEQSPRAHRQPRGAAGRAAAAAAAAGIRGRRAGSAVPSPAGGAAAAGARARRGGGSVGSDPARARARTPPSRPWPRAARPPPAAGCRQSAPLPRRLARRGSGGGRCAGCAGREVPPGGSWRRVRASLCPAVHRTMGNRSSVSARRAGQRLGRAGSHRWPRERAPRSRELFCLPVSCFGSRLPPPPSPAGPSAPLFPQGEWALSRGERTWRRTQRSAGRAGPAWPTQSRREAGRGGGEGRGGQWLGAEPSAPLHHPGPPLPVHRPRRPRPERPHTPAGSQAGTTVALLGAQPRPAPALAGGPSPQTLPGFFPTSIAGDSRSSPHPARPAALSADPRPYLLTRVWAARRAALCPRPRPWRVDGRREPGRRAERCAGPGTRPGDRGAAGSLQCAREK